MKVQRRPLPSLMMINHSSIFRAGSKKHAGRLNIYGPPTARAFPQDLKAVEGLEFVLQCPMGGYPLEKISWEKDGLSLSSGLRRKLFTQNGTLVIKKVVKESDEGRYTCHAKSRNGRNSASASTGLRVIGKYCVASPGDFLA